MNLHRITTIKDLSRFTPKLLELHSELDGKWEPDSTPHEFLLELINVFGPKSYFYGDLAENGDLIYFAAIIDQGGERALFWLFYMNKNYRDKTREILTEIKRLFKSMGFTAAYCQTTRLSSSYERWLEKFGGKKFAIVYKLNI